MRKCKGIGDAAVMEATQVVGMRTRARTLALAAAAAAGRGRSSKTRMAVVGSGEIQISYLQLRSRSLVMKPRITRSTANSGGRWCPSSELGRISQSSSNASCEVASEEPLSPSGDPVDGEVLDTAARCSECSSNGKETTTPSSSPVEEWGDLEPTTERTSRRRRRAEIMPSEAEIEEFFAAAERDQWQRFAAKYNYDILNDAPFEGRYEWFRIP